MREYLDLLEYVLKNGKEKSDRTNTGTLSLFGPQLRFNLSEGFPIVTTKRIYWKGVVGELLWFLRGDTNVKWLNENGIYFWDDWADENGDLGPIYGKQLRSWDSPKEIDINHPLRVPHWSIVKVDQVKRVINQIKNNPDSRRHVITTWNPGDIEDMNLPPCHGLVIQFHVNKGKLSCHMYQRSADLFIGVPFNISSYSLFTHMVAHVCNLKVDRFIHTFGDAHIYKNHIDQVKIQLEREPLDKPELVLNPEVTDIDDFGFEDIELKNYKYLPHIKAEVAV